MGHGVPLPVFLGEEVLSSPFQKGLSLEKHSHEAWANGWSRDLLGRREETLSLMWGRGNAERERALDGDVENTGSRRECCRVPGAI